MNILNVNSPVNFGAKWSETTLAKAQKVDERAGTNLKEELQRALDNNPDLKNFGGDEVELSLGSRPEYYVGSGWKQQFTAVLTKKFFDGKQSISSIITPPCLSKATYAQPEGVYDNYPLTDYYVLSEMSQKKDVKNQVLAAVADSKNFTAGFIDGFANFFQEQKDKPDAEKSKLFKEFFG